MNCIQITGRTTQEIILKTTGTGKHYCKFRIGVNRPRAKDVSDFFTIVAWGTTADVLVNKVGKGSLIGVSGVLTTNSWETNKGDKRVDYEIVANEVDFLSLKEVATVVPEELAPAPSEFPSTDDADDLLISGDDLPFPI